MCRISFATVVGTIQYIQQILIEAEKRFVCAGVPVRINLAASGR